MLNWFRGQIQYDGNHGQLLHIDMDLRSLAIEWAILWSVPTILANISATFMVVLSTSSEEILVWVLNGGSFAVRSHDRPNSATSAFTGCIIVILVLGNTESHFMSVYELFSVRYGRVKWFCTHFCTRFSHLIQAIFPPDEPCVTHLHFRHIQQLNVTNIYVRDTRLTSLAGFWYHR